ncbi:MAG: hypothetical protein ACI8P9_001505, partial [Parasphingorhabdus sp.]
VLIPILKGWCTEVGAQMTSLGVQVHGGMGFIEETGAAQYYRDVRITQIYEGTTGIQAADLAGRKLLRDGGLTTRSMLEQIQQDINSLGDFATVEAKQLVDRLNQAMSEIELSVQSLLEQGSQDAGRTMGVSVPYLMQFGYLVGGWMMARSYMAARNFIDNGSDDPFYQDKLYSCQYYMTQILPLGQSHHARVMAGGEMIVGVSDDWFDRAY